MTKPYKHRPSITYNNTTISISMAMVYVSDELIFRIKLLGEDKPMYVRKAIEEKLNVDEAERKTRQIVFGGIITEGGHGVSDAK